MGNAQHYRMLPSMVKNLRAGLLQFLISSQVLSLCWGSGQGRGGSPSPAGRNRRARELTWLRSCEKMDIRKNLRSQVVDFQGWHFAFSRRSPIFSQLPRDYLN